MSVRASKASVVSADENYRVSIKIVLNGGSRNESYFQSLVGEFGAEDPLT